MTLYTVAISFAVEGKEKHAAKVADNAEWYIATSKRVVPDSLESTISRSPNPDEITPDPALD